MEKVPNKAVLAEFNRLLDNKMSNIGLHKLRYYKTMHELSHESFSYMHGDQLQIDPEHILPKKIEVEITEKMIFTATTNEALRKIALQHIDAQLRNPSKPKISRAGSSPPQKVQRLIGWFCDADSAEDAIGNLDELFDIDIERYSRWRARLRYHRAALGVAWRCSITTLMHWRRHV